MSDAEKALIVNALSSYIQTLIDDECYEDAKECAALIVMVNVGIFV